MSEPEWKPEPRCSEEGVDAVLEHIRSWLLNPTPRTALPAISTNGTFFEVVLDVGRVDSWNRMMAEQQAENIRWLFRETGH